MENRCDFKEIEWRLGGASKGQCEAAPLWWLTVLRTDYHGDHRNLHMGSHCIDTHAWVQVKAGDNLNNICSLVNSIIPVSTSRFQHCTVSWKRSAQCQSCEFVLAGAFVVVWASESCLTLLWPRGLQPTRLLCPWDFPSRNTGVCCHFLLQGIFLTQESNLWFLHWQVGSLPPEPPGKPLWSLTENQSLEDSLSAAWGNCSKEVEGEASLYVMFWEGAGGQG